MVAENGEWKEGDPQGFLGILGGGADHLRIISKIGNRSDKVRYMNGGGGGGESKRG